MAIQQPRTGQVSSLGADGYIIPIFARTSSKESGCWFSSLPKLLQSRTAAKERVKEQIRKGNEIHNITISDKGELEAAQARKSNWTKYTIDLLLTLFNPSSFVEEFEPRHGMVAVGLRLSEKIDDFKREMGTRINRLESILERIDLMEYAPESLKPHVYDSFQFHPKVKGASESLFKSGHYAQAIFEAFKVIEVMVKEKSGISNKYGQDLMAHVFSEDRPILRLSSDPDEQAGFRFLFMGVMRGIRDPKAHHIIPQVDPNRTVEYLSLASLLPRRIEESGP